MYNGDSGRGSVWTPYRILRPSEFHSMLDSYMLLYYTEIQCIPIERAWHEYHTKKLEASS